MRVVSSMKKSLFMLIMIIFSVLLTACDDEDWVPHTSESYDISIPCEENIFKISEIESEISAIADTYSEGTELVYVRYKFEDDNKGYAMFGFRNEYEKNERIYVATVDIYVDLYEETAYKVNYYEGTGKASGGYGSNRVGNKNKDAYDIYISNKDNLETNEGIEYYYLIYMNGDILLNGCREDDSIIDGIECE